MELGHGPAAGPLGNLQRGAQRRSLAAHAKKKTKKGPEYGSGRQELGLPPLGGGGEAVGEVVPKLSDYLAFGAAMGERPAEVQRQLELNNTPVEVDPEGLELLSDWESEEFKAYAVFEALMEQEAEPDRATNSVLERNKNRAGVAEVRPPARQGSGKAAPVSAAQRKLAKNKSRSTAPLTLSALRTLGDAMKAAGQSSVGAFEQLAAKPVRPGTAVQALAAKPQWPSLQSQAAASALEEDTSFLDDDALWADLAPTYGDFERALGSAPSAGAAAARQAAAKKQAPQQLLPKPAAATKPRPAGRPAAPPPRVLKPVPALAQRPARAPQATLAPPPQRFTPAPAPHPAPAPQPALTPPPQRPAPAPHPARASQPTLAPAPQRSAPAPPAPSSVTPPAAKPPAKPQRPIAAATPAMPAPLAEAPAGPPAHAAQPLPVPPPEQEQTSEQELTRQEQQQPPQPEQPEQQAVAAQPPPPQQAVPQLKQPPQRPSLKSLLSDALAAQAVTALTSKPAAQEPSQQSPPPPPPPQQQQQQQHVEQRRKPKPPAEVQPDAAQQAVPGDPASKALQRPPQPATRPPRLPPFKGRGGGGRAQGMPEGWKQQALQYAQECLDSGRSEGVRVWQVNSAGVLVENDYLSGFIPLTLLSTAHGRRVLEEEGRLAQRTIQEEGGPPQELPEEVAREQRTRLRRQAMSVLLGETIAACVLSVDRRNGQVVMSERAAVAQQKAAADAKTLEVAEAALLMLGKTLPVTIYAIKPFGVFVEFEIPASEVATSDATAAGTAGGAPPPQRDPLKGVGLVHASQLSWDRVPDPSLCVEVGQTVPAVVSYVDPDKGRIFFSIREAQPHPLQETLETLIQLSASSTPPAGAQQGKQQGEQQQQEEGKFDLRPVLGDMPDAVRFCEAIQLVPDVLDVRLGVRLQSRASSQALEVYLAKAERGLDPEDDLAAILGLPGTAFVTYQLVLRKGLCVQEVTVAARKSREDMRQLAMSIVANMVEAEAEA